MEIYMTQIPSMPPALTLPVVESVPVDTRPSVRIAPTHLLEVAPWSVRMTVVDDVPQLPQVERVLTQAELEQDLLTVDQQQAYGGIKVQGLNGSLGSTASLMTRTGSTGSKGITGNKGAAGSKRAFSGVRGVPPRGRPV